MTQHAMMAGVHAGFTPVLMRWDLRCDGICDGNCDAMGGPMSINNVCVVVDRVSPMT